MVIRPLSLRMPLWMGSSQAAQGVPQSHALVCKRLEPGQSSRLQKKNFLDQNVNKFIDPANSPLSSGERLNVSINHRRHRSR